MNDYGSFSVILSDREKTGAFWIVGNAMDLATECPGQ
jgi:hypothetical protein